MNILDDRLSVLPNSTCFYLSQITWQLPASLAAADDRTVLAALITEPRYDHDYATPYNGRPQDVHGPFRLDVITPDDFHRCTGVHALDILQSWSRELTYPYWSRDTWLACNEPISAWAWPTLASAETLYQLAVPRQGNEHSWGWVVGFGGFHEFVAIDRTHCRVTLLNATDD
ncbi:hypothetical protein BH09ACT8_BH09ACT8_66580 [soil metagenome]